jgi:hypothetical protein
LTTDARVLEGPEDRCSLRSRLAAEPLGGTASTIRRWLLVEHDGPWGRDGLLDARLPDGIGPSLRELGRRAAARVLLIRRHAGGAGAGRVTCFAVDTAEAWIGRRDVDRIEEVATIDPRDRAAFTTQDVPVFVTCTHGRRDPCCAERGRPVAAALAAAEPEAAWESTHVGGDRFAANVVAFPHGLVFGRLEPQDVSGLVTAYREGRIAPLHRYRGRTSDARDVQTAEMAVRAELHLAAIEDVRLEERSVEDDRARLVLSTPSDVRAVVDLRRRPGVPMRLTCHSAREESLPRWTVERIERPAP